MSALIAGLGALVTALADNGLTWLEVALIAFTAASAFGTVYGVTNKPTEAPRPRPGP